MNRASGIILAVHPNAELYGADRILAECLAFFPDRNVTLILPRDGPLIPYLRNLLPNLDIVVDPTVPAIARKFFTIPGVFLFLTNCVRFALRLKQLNKKAPIDFIYVSTVQSFAVSALARTLRIPCCVHVHEIIEKPKFIFGITTWIIARCANRVICVSSAVRRNMLRNSAATANSRKFVVVHNGIRGFFQERTLKKPVQEPQKVVFSLFGRIKPEKGQWLLVEALTRLSREERSRIQVNIVGGVVSGKEHLIDELRAEIERADLDAVVSLLPFTEDISEFMRLSDICLVPSIMEDPFPTTVLEAMSAGKPVIGARTGGIPEMITHGSTGFLISPKSPEEFASRIRLLLNRPDLIRTLGDEGRARFEENFTIERFMCRFRAVILGGFDGTIESAP